MPMDVAKFMAQMRQMWAPQPQQSLGFFYAAPPVAQVAVVQVAVAFFVGLCVGLLLPRLRQPFQRFLTVDDIPMRYFREERQLNARVVKVTDGDTLRVRHCPLWSGPGSYTGKLSENTLQIRLAGIDTPETAKFGHSGQPYGEEAKEWLTNALGDSTIRLTLLHKDQYSRAVCMVHDGSSPFSQRNMSEEMLKAGLAHIYRQAGAVYGGRLEAMQEMEAEARHAKRGIWAQGDKIESASEYKARQRAGRT